MAKNIMSDVQIPLKRSIRMVPLPKMFEAEVEEGGQGGNRKGGGRSRQPHRYILWGLVIVCILILFFVAMTAFSGATITITPKNQTINIDEVITASKNGQNTDLGYQLITLSDSVSKQISATDQRIEEKKASGKIEIYNNSTTAPQRLIRNTRFTSTSGLVYRIAEPVEIPGKKGLVPGSIEVTVFAEEPGPKYNSGLTDFTIPGFKTNPEKFKNIYARSKTNMTGGSKGVVNVVRAADAKVARQEMNADLKNRLLASARSQTPTDFVFFDSVSVMNIEQVPDVTVEKMATLSQKATLTAVILNKKAFAKTLAIKTIDMYDEKDVDLKNVKDLNVSIQGFAIGVFDKDPIRLKVSGSATLVWTYDQDKIKYALAGKSTADFKSILATFPEVNPIKAVVKPFWKSVFPEQVNKISVVESK